MKKYIKIARPDHWIKQLFIFPGCLFAILLSEKGVGLSTQIFTITIRNKYTF